MTDPNADIIGFSFTYESGETYTVEETARWSSKYVNGKLRYPNGNILNHITKPAELVRRRKELDGA